LLKLNLGIVIALFFLLVFALMYGIKFMLAFFVHCSCQPKNYWTSFNGLLILFNMTPAARALTKVNGDKQMLRLLGNCPIVLAYYLAKNRDMSWLWTASALWRDKRLVTVLRYEQKRLSFVKCKPLSHRL